MPEKKIKRIVRPATAEERKRHADIRRKVMEEFPPADTSDLGNRVRHSKSNLGSGQADGVDNLEQMEKNAMMKTADLVTELDIESRAVMEHLMTGKPIDPEIKRRIQERAAKITQQVRNQFGLVDIAVPAIRELRGELPNP